MRLLQKTVEVKAGDWAFWQMLMRKEKWHGCHEKNVRVRKMLAEIREAAMTYGASGIPLWLKNELKYLDDHFRNDPYLLKPQPGTHGTYFKEVREERRSPKNTRLRLRRKSKPKPKPQGIPNDRLIHLKEELLGAWAKKS